MNAFIKDRFMRNAVLLLFVLVLIYQVFSFAQEQVIYTNQLINIDEIILYVIGSIGLLTLLMFVLYIIPIVSYFEVRKIFVYLTKERNVTLKKDNIQKDILFIKEKSKLFRKNQVIRC